MKSYIVTAAFTAAMGLAGSLFAQAIPFSNSTFTLNHSVYEDTVNSDAPTISGGVLTMTNLGTSDANTAYYNVPVSFAQPFVASFVYQATDPSYGPPTYYNYGADGITFVMAALADGEGNIGGRGAGLGWGNNDSNSPARPADLPNYIANSAAIELTDDYLDGGGNGDNTGLVTAGPTGGSAGNYLNTPLQFSDPILVTFSYDGIGSLTETLTDEDTLGTFSNVYSINLASVTGSTGYIGFTAGSGGYSSIQTVSDLSFTSTAVPEPASLGLLALGGLGMLRRRR